MMKASFKNVLTGGTVVGVLIFGLLALAFATRMTHPSDVSHEQLPSVGVVAEEVTNLDCTPAPPSVLLPADQEYEECLYAWMQSLSQSDFIIPIGAEAGFTWDGTYPSEDWLFRYWSALTSGNVSNPARPGGTTFFAEPKWFVLDDGAGAGIEGTGTVHYTRWASTAAFWTTVNLPNNDASQGNPFFESTELCNRALVTVAVDMIMTDFYHGQKNNPWGTDVWAKDDPRFLGGLLNYWAQVYGDCRSHIAMPVQEAFEEGYRRMLQKLLERGVSRHTPNMQTRTVSAAAHVYASTEDTGLKDLALRTARTFMFGREDGEWLTKQAFPRSLVYPAGYVQEGWGPETTYNGVSLYHLAEARAVTEGARSWDFMDAPLRQMSDFRNHQLFMEPDGTVIGPSAYAGRTGAGWERLQSSDQWRDLTLASYYEEALPNMKPLVPPLQMIRDIQRFLSGGRTRKNRARASTAEAIPFAIDHDHHWPGVSPYLPAEGTYETLEEASEASRALPFARRGHYFSRSFANDFWVVKGRNGRSEGASDYGFFIESEADAGTYGGYTGGSLQAFWTQAGGLFILGRKDKDSRGGGPAADMIPSHHLWGTFGDSTFSSSHVKQRTVTYYGAVDSVSVAGSLRRSDAPMAGVDLYVDSRFARLPDGLGVRHVVSTLAGNSVTVDGLWVTLPVNLGLCQRSGRRARTSNQCGDNDTSIEYWTGNPNGNWQTLTTTLTETSMLRLGRDWGRGSEYVYVVFEKDEQVRLSPSVWQQSYQGSSRIRPVHISMIAEPGRDTELPATVELAFSFQTMDVERR